MENFEIIEDKTLELTFEVKDESHGVFNALRHILMQDRKHQQAIGISFFFVEYICSNIEIQIQKAILILLNIKSIEIVI